MAGSPPDTWRKLAKTLDGSRNIVDSWGLLCFRKRTLAPILRIGPLDPLQTLETSRPQKTIMMLRDYFLQFLEFEKWANQRVVDYLEKHPEDKRSLKVFCHLIADIEP